MLIPVTFKNNDKPAVKNQAGDIIEEAVVTKIGKVTSAIARMIYANALYKKTGIIQNYKNANTTSCSIASYETTDRNTIKITFNKGAFAIYGGIGIIENGTTFEIEKSINIANGSLGVRVNLGNEAGEEVNFYAKEANTLQKNNLLINEQNGIYDFELYKFTLQNGVFTLGKKNEDEIILSNEEVLKDLDSFVKLVDKTSNSITLSVGNNTIYMGW